MTRLDYATQVSELEKMARLAPPQVVAREPPALVPSRDKCLVCGKRPARACEECRSVSYCCAAHQRRDARFHDAVCAALRTIAEDARATFDPRELLAALRVDRVPADWSECLPDDPDPVRRRRTTDLATRPLTLASMVHALGLPASDVLRVHVMGASSREQDLPTEAWDVAARLLARRIELTLIGPELREAPGARVELYSLPRFREKPDLVIGYDCGLLMYPTWKTSIIDLVGSGVPFVITSFRPWEAAAEDRLLRAIGATPLVEPMANPFRSLSGKRSTTIANDLSYDNAFVSAWR